MSKNKIAKKVNKITKKIHSKIKTQKKQPGIQSKMSPRPLSDNYKYIGSNKLKNKVAIITGGDSGIGRAVAIFFAKEGADIVIAYLNEHKDAKITKNQVEEIGQKCLLISGDLSQENFCKKIVKQTIKQFGHLDILVNNSGEQHSQTDIEKVSAKQMLKTFNTNVFSYFYMVKAALPFLRNGSTIVNTASVTAYKGSDHLIDYSSTKGAIVSFTRSLSKILIKNGIRVNGVAPGPVWTPLIVASFDKKHIKEFGKNVPMQRPAQPEEIAPSYVFLASNDSSYMTGQFLHPNGGVIING